jgi:DNA-directed RNA polymerase subunit RPC12/RpoP
MKQKIKKLYCSKCNKEFKDINDLNDLEIEEWINEGSFVCSDCINEEMDNDNHKNSGGLTK